MSAHRRADAGVWWVSPVGAALLVVPASLLAAALYTDADYRALWGTAKSLTPATVLLIACALAVFLLGALLPMFGHRRAAGTPWPALPPRSVPLLRAAARWLLGLTLFGYAALVGAAVTRGLRPADVAAALAGQAAAADNLKQLFAPVTGVTSLTQMGIAFAVVATVLIVSGAAPRRRLLVGLGLVTSLAAARAFLASERLALIEVVLPAVAVVAMAAATGRRPWARSAARAAPAALLPAAVVLFGVFEHSRSWAFYQRTSSGGFLDFALARFAGYYATAYNNHQLLADHTTVVAQVPFGTLEGLWSAPGVASAGLYEALNGGPPAAVGVVLAQYGNPEFNNPCGICTPLLDYGHIGGLVFIGVAGVVVGAAYWAFANAAPVGLLVYPPLFTGVLELPRYLYWTQGRLLPALTVLAVLGLLVARVAREPVDGPARDRAPAPARDRAPAPASGPAAETVPSQREAVAEHRAVSA